MNNLPRSSVVPRPPKRTSPMALAKQRDHPDDGEDGEQAEDEGLRIVRRHQREADRDADQPEGEYDQPPGAGDAAGTVDQRLGTDRMGGAITHGGRVWPPAFADCGGCAGRINVNASYARMVGKVSEFNVAFVRCAGDRRPGHDNR